VNKRIACIGECMVELSERPDGTMTRGFGGDTLNTALYLARLGVPTEYVTALGDDRLSDEMLDAWRQEGIGTALVARVRGRLPGLYLIRTDETGERQFLYWRDGAPVRQLFQLPEAAMIGDAVGTAGLVYFSGITLSLFDESSRDRLFTLLERTRAAGGRVAFDTNFRTRGWPDLELARLVYARAFGVADLVFASVEDHFLLYGTAEPDAVLGRLRSAGVGEVVVKYARPACRVVADGVDAVVEAAPIMDVADTTAAGDSFAAAYLAARSAGQDPVAAAHAGHGLAGVVVQYRGAIVPRAAMPATQTAAEAP
jgi:2-dehydro-3-deoxygluconokinase